MMHRPMLEEMRQDAIAMYNDLKGLSDAIERGDWALVAQGINELLVVAVDDCEALDCLPPIDVR